MEWWFLLVTGSQLEAQVEAVEGASDVSGSLQVQSVVLVQVYDLQ